MGFSPKSDILESTPFRSLTPKAEKVIQQAMHAEIEQAFAGLSARAKIAVLARAIHMETIHNRGQPEVAERLYRSSELVHRLAGSIMSLAYRPDDFERDATLAAKALIEGVAIHGQPYLTELQKWIVEARTIS